MSQPEPDMSPISVSSFLLLRFTGEGERAQASTSVPSVERSTGMGLYSRRHSRTWGSRSIRRSLNIESTGVAIAADEIAVVTGPADPLTIGKANNRA